VLNANITLQDVQHVPNLQFNLIFASKLAKHIKFLLYARPFEEQTSGSW